MIIVNNHWFSLGHSYTYDHACTWFIWWISWWKQSYYKAFGCSSQGCHHSSLPLSRRRLCRSQSASPHVHRTHFRIQLHRRWYWLWDQSLPLALLARRLSLAPIGWSWHRGMRVLVNGNLSNTTTQTWKTWLGPLQAHLGRLVVHNPSLIRLDHSRCCCNYNIYNQSQ